MKLDQIQIRTTDAKIDLTISDSQQYIKQRAAKQFIEQPAATLQISHKDAKLLVDSSQAYRDLGLLSPKESVQQFAQNGLIAVQEGVSRRVSEGNALMNIGKNSGNAIVNVAKQHDTFEQQRLGIEWKPSVGAVKIKYIAGSLQINIQANKPKIDVKLGGVDHQATRSDVSGTVIQRPTVETTVIKGE